MAQLDIQGKAAVQDENVSRSKLDGNLDRLDKDLEIMERHAGMMDQEESEIQESMKKWDREYKDARLHSIPRPRKHIR
jgi:hypothetical protein